LLPFFACRFPSLVRCRMSPTSQSKASQIRSSRSNDTLRALPCLSLQSELYLAPVVSANQYKLLPRCLRTSSSLELTISRNISTNLLYVYVDCITERAYNTRLCKDILYNTA